ncbi:hypothetical protein BJX66DRAFT_219903 [Aspergillus keveii]|uniref:Secreted protein n=1 Tax=Aspergillus keveii TaxID=714993 RepID=A0ABR4G455_9EURO
MIFPSIRVSLVHLSLLSACIPFYPPEWREISRLSPVFVLQSSYRPAYEPPAVFPSPSLGSWLLAPDSLLSTV